MPKSSDDSALTAFAQLGALRLNTSRALISLLDTTHQYVLAESTQSLSSQSDDRHDLDDGLWIGSVVLPRETGICEVVLTCDPIKSAANSQEDISHNATNEELVIIPDLRDDSRFCTRRYVTDGPRMRFYAGAPLRNVDGTIIGAFCVFDDVSLLKESRALLAALTHTYRNPDRVSLTRVSRSCLICPGPS